MAEGVLFNIAEGIIGRLGSHAFQEVGLIWGVKDELQMLQQMVTQLQAVLLDAEQKQANNQVKLWLQSLEDVVYDADDVLDVFYCEAQRRQMVPGNNKISNQVRIFFSSSNQLAFRRKIGHKIKHIKERLNVIATLRTNFHLEEGFEETQHITRERETYSFVPMEKIIGRDEDKRAVIQLLLDTISEENVSTISIVGFGGLGKTVLAQLVFNDKEVQKHFDLKMWICVSNVFELSIIVKKIIESATNETPKSLSMDQLQKKLREKINGKRYLLVLEDVWNQNREKWLGLKELLMGGAKGSRILITTRCKIVAEVSDTAKAYALRGLDEKQSCLFPSGYEISVGNLVKLWVAQGFIKSSDQNECLEDVGYGYFMELLWRSFFHEETKDDFGTMISCKMHDVMNALAISVSGTVSTIIDQNRENFVEKCRHVSLNFPVKLSKWKIPSSLLKANKIRSLLFLRECLWYSDDEKGLSESFCNTISSYLKSLRMLSLNGLGFTTVPKCLSKMQQLRYLNLGHNRMTRLPNWVVKLQNLQTLDLSACYNLMELPRDLKKMINLRHLMLTDCDSLTHMPCGLGELMCLRTLDRFVLCRQDSSIKRFSAGLGELKKLNKLRGRLEIANLGHGKDVSESNVASIMKRETASLFTDFTME
ncbi:hypothetical protein M0R45_008740 [Rubus argutus]|uniref:Disease resistance protein RGA3 n=1 Tax=Rubus argutus TaxID=59490 RepID=A0AAW1Y3T5_RUBAR